MVLLISTWQMIMLEGFMEQAMHSSDASIPQSNYKVNEAYLYNSTFILGGPYE